MANFISCDQIEKLNLSVRSYNALRRNGYDTIDQLMGVTDAQLCSIRNLGKKSIDEISIALHNIVGGAKDDISLDVSLDDIVAEKIDTTVEDKIIFRDQDGILRQDIPISDLDLTVRAYNCLHKAGIEYASELVGSTEESLMEIKNMGKLSVQCILSVMESLSFDVPSVNFESTELTEESTENKICATIVDVVKSKLSIHAGILYKQIEQIVCRYLLDNPQTSIKEALYDHSLYYSIFDIYYLRSALKEKIIEMSEKSIYGIKVSSLSVLLPEQLYGSNLLKKIIDELVTSGYIFININGDIEKKFPTILEYTESLPIEKDRLILKGRLNGKTLEEVGQESDLTRERVRQKVEKHLRTCPRLTEDRYARVFKKFRWTKESFVLAFDESELTYNYLNMAYERSGALPLDELLEDESFPIEFRKAAEKAVYKDYIKVGSERVLKSRSELIDYALRTYCLDDILFDDFCEIYFMLLQDYGLENDERLLNIGRGYENKLADSNHVLWKFGRKLRYYNIEDFDFRELIQTLALEQYHNVEYSTLKFFRDFPALMRRYDIRDEYELHNLLKKISNKITSDNISFKRMPNIEFGTANRQKQMLEILLQCAPVSIIKLAAAYDAEYGVRSDTVMANYLKEFDEYFYDGMYTLDSPELPESHATHLRGILNNDFYSISEIRRIYLREFPREDPLLINPHTLKLLGFLVYSTYSIRATFSSAADYFRHLLLESDIVDLNSLPRELISNGTFCSQLYVFRSQLKIIEFLPSQYINIRRLNQVGVTNEKLLSYCNAVSNFVERGDYFTIKSLSATGFRHSADDLGFDDWFYGSLLTEDRDRFSYGRMGNTKVFIRGKKDVTMKEFVGFLVDKVISMDIYDLIAIMADKYGVNTDKTKIIELVKSSSMYYDSIMEKVYIDYNTYFEEV